jgi:tetratricopeptide (TPR) repeat protein
LVTAYGAVNRAGDAEKVLTHALEKNPKDVDARLQQGELFLATGKYEQAETNLNKVLQLQPTSATAHYVKAQLNRVRGQALTYRQELSEALRLDPYVLAARLESARLFETSKNPKEALRLLDETPPSQRGASAVTVERNWALWTLGDLPEMRKGIDQGLSRSRTFDLLLQDGFWKLRSNNPTGARAALEEALKIDPANVRALGALRQTYAATKQDDLGLKKVREYAALRPKSAPLQEYLGFQLMMKQDRAGAATAFAAAKAADPADTSVEIAKAMLDVANHRLDDAAAKLKIAADSGNLKARMLLGKIRERQGNHAAALEEFQKIVNQEPDNAEALNNLAYLLAGQGGHTDEALKYAQKAEELAPDNPEYADTLGWILYQKGLYPSAITQLGTAASHKGNAVWKYHLAMAYAKAGDLSRGRSTLDAALKANPDLPEAKVAKEMMGVSK